jgi:hypothetical protein
MSETDLSRSIRLALATLGIWVIRVQSGTHRVRGGTLHCAEPGTPDLCLPGLGWLEVKTQGGALEASQVAWHQRATREGVNVAVVRSVEQAVRVVREWKAERGLRSGQQPPLCAEKR